MEMCTAELRYQTILPLIRKSRGASAVSDRRSSNAVVANSPLLNKLLESAGFHIRIAGAGDSEIARFRRVAPALYLAGCPIAWYERSGRGRENPRGARRKAGPQFRRAGSGAGQAHFPMTLTARLLETVLLLETERIAAVIGLTSVRNPTFAAELSRRADAPEFTPIMRAVQSGRQFERG
jgi:hypothetical protein